MSERIRAQYPQSMTIILQHQFWDLAVRDEAFEVGLSFGGIPEKLTVPFEAITGFFDPAVQFGFQFETSEAAPRAMRAATLRRRRPRNPQSPRLARRRKQKKPMPCRRRTAKEETPNAGGGEVVSLDRFRKK